MPDSINQFLYARREWRWSLYTIPVDIGVHFILVKHNREFREFLQTLTTQPLKY